MIPTGVQDINVYTDFNDINRLKSQANSNPDMVLEKVARQFESLFTQTLLKTMRDAHLSEDTLFDNDQSKMYQDLFDKQLANNLSSKRGLGLADMMVRQLSRKPVSASNTHADVSKHYRTVEVQSMPSSSVSQSVNTSSFISELKPLAEQVEGTYKIPAPVILAQAVLETGWGKHVPRNPDGSSSHNLFGIKAGSDWQGRTVMKSTTEYIAGNKIQLSDAFRSYSSYKDSMHDYAEFLAGNSRYATAFNNPDDPVKFITAIHNSGYATDPDYTDKINRIMNSQNFSDAMAG